MAGAEPNGAPMVDADDFLRMVEEYRKEDEQREIVIKRSRDVQKLSKQAIFSLHRGNASQAETRLRNAVRITNELSPIIYEWPKLRSGSFAYALEEYAEAVAFRGYLKEGRLLKLAEVQAEVPLVAVEEYLGGVLDFTGELLRYSIFRATERNIEAVQNCKDLVEGLMEAFMEFDMRNGQLRKKYDSLKYTLSKMENTLYELSLTASGLRKDIGREDDMVAHGTGED
eukprot:evm.model.scf_1883.3 EVM.evm.TU.scf_1883.3   scf_1883:11343-14020(-)